MPTNLAKLCLAILILCQCEHLYEATTPATSKITTRNIVTDIIAKFFTSSKPKKKIHHPTFRPSFSPSLTPSSVKDDQDEPESDEVAPPIKSTTPSKKPVGLPSLPSTATDEDPTDAIPIPSKSPVAKGESPKAGKKAPKLLPTAPPLAPDSKTDDNTDGDDSSSSEPKTSFPSSSPLVFEAPSAPDEETMLPIALPKSSKKKKGKIDKPSSQPIRLSKGDDSEKTKPGGAKDDSGSETGKNADDHADGNNDTDSGSETGKNADDHADGKTGGGHKDDTTIGGAENINEEIKIEDSAALSGSRFFFYAFVFCMIFACVAYGMRR